VKRACLCEKSPDDRDFYSKEARYDIQTRKHFLPKSLIQSIATKVLFDDDNDEDGDFDL
jgi:hypothetical protein